MSNSISVEELGEAVSDLLRQYNEEGIEAVNAAGEKAMKKLVKLTKNTAPRDEGDFAKAITSTAEEKFTGDKVFTWGVKAPERRKTHLLVNGHLAVNGTRVQGDPFLENAMNAVLPEYEADVEEALTE